MLSFLWMFVDAEIRGRSMCFWKLLVSYREMRFSPYLVRYTTTSSVFETRINTLYCAPILSLCRQQHREPLIKTGQTAQDQKRKSTGHTIALRLGDISKGRSQNSRRYNKTSRPEGRERYRYKVEKGIHVSAFGHVFEQGDGTP